MYVCQKCNKNELKKVKLQKYKTRLLANEPNKSLSLCSHD